MEYYLANEAATFDFGAALAGVSQPGLFITFSGQLGMGKTTLIRGFLQALGYTGAVKSPTYTLVEPYKIINKNIFHFDLYRLHGPDELEAIGFRDYFDGQAMVLLEWPEQGQGYLPKPDIQCTFQWLDQGRNLIVLSHSPVGEQILDQIEW